ncbi:MAG: hypothetical protein EXX96DRAFT_652881 [Benjaminiella poitrasii]|nr:MAG: hypothetical protein EXX96DRAFT_652881 [Benjaminiella poitrasii]
MPFYIGKSPQKCVIARKKSYSQDDSFDKYSELFMQKHYKEEQKKSVSKEMSPSKNKLNDVVEMNTVNKERNRSVKARDSLSYGKHWKEYGNDEPSWSQQQQNDSLPRGMKYRNPTILFSSLPSLRTNTASCDDLTASKAAFKQSTHSLADSQDRVRCSSRGHRKTFPIVDRIKPSKQCSLAILPSLCTSSKGTFSNTSSTNTIVCEANSILRPSNTADSFQPFSGSSIISDINDNCSERPNITTATTKAVSSSSSVPHLEHHVKRPFICQSYTDQHIDITPITTFKHQSSALLRPPHTIASSDSENDAIWKDHKDLSIESTLYFSSENNTKSRSLASKQNKRRRRPLIVSYTSDGDDSDSKDTILSSSSQMNGFRTEQKKRFDIDNHQFDIQSSEEDSEPDTFDPSAIYMFDDF